MSRKRSTLGALAGLCALLVGCDTADTNTDTSAATAQKTTTQTGSTAMTTTSELEWERVTDPVERAFTMELPKGWRNDVYLKRNGVVTANIATSTSPDGATALFYGDPKLKTFLEPSAAMPHQHNDPMFNIQTYTPAERFLPSYLKTRFGKLPGFVIREVVSEPELVQKNREVAQSSSVPVTALASASVAFDFREGESVRHGRVYLTTYSLGIVWAASLAGIVSTDDPKQHKATLFHLIESQKTEPEWKEKERVAAQDRQRQHERVMAQIAANTQQLQLNHQNNMAILNGMAVRHQARMDAIHAAGDASMAAYKARDLASDNNHRGFLNYLTDENTVAGPSGRTFQVENKYERYYINKSDNSYIGLKGGTDINDLKGINPADYEEAKILR